jgi:hypothetical protein
MAEGGPIVAPIKVRKPRKSGDHEWFQSTKTLAGAAKAAEQSGTAMGIVCLGYVIVTVATYGFNLKWFDSSPSKEGLIANVIVGTLALLLSWRGFANPGPIKAILIFIWVVLEFVWKIEMVAAKYPGSFFINIVATVFAFNGIRGAFALRRLRKQATTEADAFA